MRKRAMRIGSAIATSLLVVSLFVVGTAARSGEESGPATVTAEPEVATVPPDAVQQGSEFSAQGTEDPEALPLDDPIFEPAGICRMAPQCDTNADCDVWCGPDGGRCGHSRCPVRVCKCN